MPRTYQSLAFDKAIANSAAVMRAMVGDDDQLTAVQPGDRDRLGTAAGCDNRTDGDVTALDPEV